MGVEHGPQSSKAQMGDADCVGLWDPAEAKLSSGTRKIGSSSSMRQGEDAWLSHEEGRLSTISTARLIS